MRERKLVVAALVRQDEEAGRILMSRRRADQAMPNLWEFPGGKVEPGEHPRRRWCARCARSSAAASRSGGIHEVVFHAYPEFDLYMLVYASRIVDGDAARRRGRRRSRGSSDAIARAGFPARGLPARPASWPPRPSARRLDGRSAGGLASIAAVASGAPRRAAASRPGPGCAFRSASRSASHRLHRVALARAASDGSAQAPRCVCSWLSGGQ